MIVIYNRGGNQRLIKIILIISVIKDKFTDCTRVFDVYFTLIWLLDFDGNFHQFRFFLLIYLALRGTKAIITLVIIKS